MTATMTIGTVAVAAGLSRKAIRLYEARGLLPATQRTAAGYRIYTETDATRLRFIAAARRLGLHLDQIAVILNAAQAGQTPCQTTRELFDQRISEIDSVVKDLTSLRDTLTATRGAEHTGTATTAGICPMIEHVQLRTEAGQHPEGTLRP